MKEYKKLALYISLHSLAALWELSALPSKSKDKAMVTPGIQGKKGLII